MKTKLLAAFAAASVLALTGCSGGDEVGDVSLGMFTLKDIKINTFQDPKVPGVTCHVASIEANLSLADPSDSSVSCRQTGEITPEMIASSSAWRESAKLGKSAKADIATANWL